MVELLGRYSKLPPLPDFAGPDHRPGRTRQPSRIHSTRRRLGPDVIDQLVTDYRAGLPTTTLMATYGVSKGSVLDLLEGAGVARRGQGQKNIDLPEAIARYQAGWSLARLAAAYDCNHETVRRALVGAGVLLRPRNGWRRRP